MIERSESVTLSRPEDVSKLLTHVTTPANLYLAPECCVCLFRIEKDLNVTKCGHLYHKECITSLLKNKQDCPTCKAKLDVDQPFVALKPFIKKTDTKEILQQEVKGRINFALSKSVYQNLKFVCGVCLQNIFDSEISITNCHH